MDLEPEDPVVSRNPKAGIKSHSFLPVAMSNISNGTFRARATPPREKKVHFGEKRPSSSASEAAPHDGEEMMTKTAYQREISRLARIHARDGGLPLRLQRGQASLQSSSWVDELEEQNKAYRVRNEDLQTHVNELQTQAEGLRNEIDELKEQNQLLLTVQPSLPESIEYPDIDDLPEPYKGFIPHLRRDAENKAAANRAVQARYQKTIGMLQRSFEAHVDRKADTMAAEKTKQAFEKYRALYEEEKAKFEIGLEKKNGKLDVQKAELNRKLKVAREHLIEEKAELERRKENLGIKYEKLVAKARRHFGVSSEPDDAKLDQKQTTIPEEPPQAYQAIASSSVRENEQKTQRRKQQHARKFHLKGQVLRLARRCGTLEGPLRSKAARCLLLPAEDGGNAIEFASTAIEDTEFQGSEEASVPDAFDYESESSDSEDSDYDDVFDEDGFRNHDDDSNDDEDFSPRSNGISSPHNANRGVERSGEDHLAEHERHEHDGRTSRGSMRRHAAGDDRDGLFDRPALVRHAHSLRYRRSFSLRKLRKEHEKALEDLDMAKSGEIYDLQEKIADLEIEKQVNEERKAELQMQLHEAGNWLNDEAKKLKEAVRVSKEALEQKQQIQAQFADMGDRFYKTKVIRQREIDVRAAELTQPLQDDLLRYNEARDTGHLVPFQKQLRNHESIEAQQQAVQALQTALWWLENDTQMKVAAGNAYVANRLHWMYTTLIEALQQRERCMIKLENCNEKLDDCVASWIDVNMLQQAALKERRKCNEKLQITIVNHEAHVAALTKDLERATQEKREMHECLVELKEKQRILEPHIHGQEQLMEQVTITVPKLCKVISNLKKTIADGFETLRDLTVSNIDDEKASEVCQFLTEANAGLLEYIEVLADTQSSFCIPQVMQNAAAYFLRESGARKELLEAIAAIMKMISEQQDLRSEIDSFQDHFVANLADKLRAEKELDQAKKEIMPLRVFRNNAMSNLKRENPDVKADIDELRRLFREVENKDYDMWELEARADRFKRHADYHFEKAMEREEENEILREKLRATGTTESQIAVLPRPTRLSAGAFTPVLQRQDSAPSAGHERGLQDSLFVALQKSTGLDTDHEPRYRSMLFRALGEGEVDVHDQGQWLENRLKTFTGEDALIFERDGEVEESTTSREESEVDAEELTLIRDLQGDDMQQRHQDRRMNIQAPETAERGSVHDLASVTLEAEEGGSEDDWETVGEGEEHSPQRYIGDIVESVTFSREDSGVLDIF